MNTDRWPSPERWSLRLFLSFVSIVLSLGSSTVYAQNRDDGLVVVVSAANTSVSSLSRKQLCKLYLGKSLKMPDGSGAVLGIYKPLKKIFNRAVLRRSNAQVEAVWSRLKFSGRSREPEEFDSIDALIRFVTEKSHAVAYLPPSSLTPELRVVLQLDNP